MLPPAHRMRRPPEFATVLRSGRTAAHGCVVLHLTVSAAAGPSPAVTAPTPARVGLIVGRSVGGSVVRHRVARRLRAQLAARLGRLPTASALVVRARPSAAEATSQRIGRDIDRGLAVLIGSASARRVAQ